MKYTTAFDLQSVNPAIIYLSQRTRSRSSQRTLIAALKDLAEIAWNGAEDPFSAPWERLRYSDTQRIRVELAKRKSAGLANVRLSVLRQLLDVVKEQEKITPEDHLRARDIPNIAHETMPRFRGLSPSEWRRLRATTARDASAAGVRDLGLMAILRGAGPRPSEVVRLDVADYTPETGALFLRHRPVRQVAHLAGQDRQAINAWLAVRGNTLATPALFTRISQSGRIFPLRFTVQALTRIIRIRGRGANIRPIPRPSDLRQRMTARENALTRFIGME